MHENTPHLAAPLYVIGIGASAGGLDALRRLLAHLEQSLAHAALIVAQHLSPHHHSKLAEILGHASPLRVCEASHDQELEANTIYVTPHDCEITLVAGRISLTRPQADAASKPSIDAFFHSLAQQKQDLAIGVILSGHGNDGAAGLMAIHRAGGITLVQDPTSAQSPSMPEAAIATGCIDRILLPEDMGLALTSLVQAQPPLEVDNTQQALQQILQRLSRHSGIEFGHYKLPTLFRRFQKRLTQLNLASAEAYLELITAEPQELDTLFKLMLIGVTQFYRDPEAFARLERELMELVAVKGPQQPIRIWIPGCASGEEAYSLALMLCQLMEERWHDCQLQIFASDLDEAAIAFARKGVYPAAALVGLPEALVKTGFVAKGDHYEVRADIRARILFTRHDVAGNPPFLKLDLISCRNMLIYFKPSLQKQLIPIFHYALNPNGLLFLGQSETIGEFGDLFDTLDPEAKLFRRKQGSLLRNIRFSTFKPQRSLQLELPSPPEPGLYSLSNLVKETLFASFEYPYAVINDSLDVQEVCGDARLYLRVGEGQLTTHILRLIQSELQIELMAVITRTQRERIPLRSPVCRFPFLGQTHYVRFAVKPLLFTSKGQDLFMVIFEAVEAPDVGLTLSASDEQELQISELRHELETVRSQLQNYIEELETGNEAFQTLNEELQSTNEEFQSTNEELETSHEELQSSYEEAQATNQALEASRHELSKAEANLWALLNNTLQAFVLINPQGETVAFNQEARGVFQRLSPTPLSPGLDFVACLKAEQRGFWETELKRALAGEVCAGERAIPGAAACWLAYTFTPVVSAGQGVQGVSLGFLDITDRVQAQETLLAQDQRFRALTENSFDGIAIADKLGLFSYVSPSIERLLGYAPAEMLGHHTSEFIHPEDLSKMGRIFSQQVVDPNAVAQIQWRQRHKNGAWRWLEGVGLNCFNEPAIAGTVVNFCDITERRQQEQDLRLSEARLRQVIDLIPAYIYARDSQNVCLLANAMTARLFKLSPQELEGRSFADLEGQLPENKASLQADQEVREHSVMRVLPEIRFESGQGPVQYLRSFKIPYTASDSGHPATLTVAMNMTVLKQTDALELQSRRT